MAGLAATRLFSAGGAGGIALTYWALRKAGMARHDVGRRMVAFLTLQYAFYPIALILFGVLLRTGVMNGEDSVELTIIPAGVAGLLLVVGLLVALIPPDLAQRVGAFAEAHGGERSKSVAAKVAKVPAIVGEGFRFALGLFAHPRAGRPGGARRGRLLGDQHRRPLGLLPRLRRARCRSPSSSRGSSSAWSPTSSRSPRPGSGPSTPG